MSGREILDDVTWLIGPGDRFGIVGANGAGKSTLLKLIDGTLTPTVGHVNIGKTVKFAVLSQRLDELEKLGRYKIKEVLSRYKPATSWMARKSLLDSSWNGLGSSPHS
mgnify:CR=1 FL=1